MLIFHTETVDRSSIIKPECTKKKPSLQRWHLPFIMVFVFNETLWSSRQIWFQLVNYARGRILVALLGLCTFRRYHHLWNHTWLQISLFTSNSVWCVFGVYYQKAKLSGRQNCHSSQHLFQLPLIKTNFMSRIQWFPCEDVQMEVKQWTHQPTLQ